jgi:hypothetical protein
MKDLFLGIWITKSKFLLQVEAIIEILELKEQAENIKQLLMGKFKTTENSLQKLQRQSSRILILFLTPYKVGVMANCRDLAFKSTNSIKYIVSRYSVCCADHWNCCLSEISEFYFYLDNENEEFIINEGIF